MKLHLNREDFTDYELESFFVNVLDKKRTFVEKFFTVMNFSFESNYVEELPNKIRHIYDLYILFKDKEVYGEVFLKFVFGQLPEFDLVKKIMEEILVKIRI